MKLIYENVVSYILWQSTPINFKSFFGIEYVETRGTVCHTAEEFLCCPENDLLVLKGKKGNPRTTIPV